MRKFLFVISLMIGSIGKMNAQDIVVSKLRSETERTIKKEADTTKWTWKRGGLLSANISQGSLSNWAAGGDNFSMAMSSYANYYVYHLHNRHSWDNNLDFNFGFVQTSSFGGRKNDDRLDLLSKYGYKIDSAKWYLSGLFNLRTQLFDGYTYSGSSSAFASTLFAPAYILLSAGFDYKPNSAVSLFISPLTARWVIVANQFLASQGKYGVDSGKTSIGELGAYVSANYNNTIGKNITYKGRLDLFSNYKHNPQNINVYMTNLFSFRINRYFSATYSLDLIYDDNIKLFGENKDSPALQMKSLIGIGFLMPIKPVRT
ncbi:MAG: DUF3078 domain-containing protein [Bacteroidota bacterium]|nr:DUF3078 domain-containing protein [Bacteroidota bacterium]